MIKPPHTDDILILVAGQLRFSLFALAASLPRRQRLRLVWLPWRRDMLPPHRRICLKKLQKETVRKLQLSLLEW